MKQAPDLIRFSDWYEWFSLQNLNYGPPDNFSHFLSLNNVFCQTIESSAREFLGNDKSSSLSATVV